MPLESFRLHLASLQGADGRLPAGQASDVSVWRDSVRRIQSLCPERVHFCHHTDVVHR